MAPRAARLYMVTSRSTIVVTRCENTKQWDVEVQCKVQLDIES